ncbi:hypothetical protein [Methanocaldococcus jannaschii]|uniref:hypothetical protein n=1 Tax=Methanocaldococcus jannaschii TaxID=2190 RepID=UPI0007DC0FDD|nr:hypothetical protein [Methanocaldococcus jannaschii]
MKYVIIIASFFKELLDEIFSENEPKLISKKENKELKKLWSDLIDDLKILLPYTTYPTITLDSLARLSRLSLKRDLKIISEYIKNENFKKQ